jgi:hypothetical protein
LCPLFVRETIVFCIDRCHRFKSIYHRFSSKELSYLIPHICSMFGPTLVNILLSIWKRRTKTIQKIC